MPSWLLCTHHFTTFNYAGWYASLPPFMIRLRNCSCFLIPVVSNLLSKPYSNWFSIIWAPPVVKISARIWQRWIIYPEPWNKLTEMAYNGSAPSYPSQILTVVRTPDKQNRQAPILQWDWMEVRRKGRLECMPANVLLAVLESMSPLPTRNRFRRSHLK
jgi:hypothetical protein